jgi:hypothetical protein
MTAPPAASRAALGRAAELDGLDRDRCAAPDGLEDLAEGALQRGGGVMSPCLFYIENP